jgi:hypothetical protein
MRRGLLFICFVLAACTVWCQPDTTVPQHHYVFEQFQKGKVLEKSGEVHELELNYNAMTSEMIFISDGRYLAIAGPEKVDTVFIGSRVFIPGDKRFYEVLTRTPYPLLEEYTGTLKEPGSNIGYGMNSTTMSATPLKSMIQGGQAYGLKLPEGYTVVPGHSFWIFVNGGVKPANSERHLNKVFPDKKAVISKWVKEHHTDFSQSADMIELVEALQQSS